MRNHASHLAVAILTAAIGIACTGRNHSVGNERVDQSGGASGVNQRMTLEGCVEAGGTIVGSIDEAVEVLDGWRA